MVAAGIPTLAWSTFLDFGHYREHAFGVAIAENDAIVAAGHTKLGGDLYGVLAGLDASGTPVWTYKSTVPRSPLYAIAAVPGTTDLLVTGGDYLAGLLLCGRVGADGTLRMDPSTNALAGSVGLRIRGLDDRYFIGETDGHLRQMTTACASTNRLSLREVSLLNGLWVEQDHFLASGATGTFNPDGFVRKVDPAGSVLWERIYPLDHEIVAVEQGGYIYVGGTLQEAIDFTVARPMYVAKLDQAGAELWRVYWDGGITDPYYTWGNHVRDLVVNPSGETLWTIRQDFGTYWDLSNTGAFDGDGNLILAGWAQENFAVAKFLIPR